MSAFSFTAPFITKEEEKAERVSLSEEEEKSVERDLFGGSSDDEPHISDGDISQSLEQVQIFIDSIDESDKQAYLEACSRVPELVATESDPLKFLRCCEFDVEAAAKRLIEYWKVRRDLFGEQRAFLPMTLGQAMEADRPALEKAVVQILPDDSFGRPVLFWDRIRSNKSVIHRDEVARIHFYMLHIMTKRTSVQKNGYVCIINLKGECQVRKSRNFVYSLQLISHRFLILIGFDLYMHFDRILDKKLFKVWYSVPAKFRAIHTFTGSGQSVVGLTMPVLKHMGGKYYRLRLVLHAGSDKELLEQLGVYGVTGEHLDAYVGGRCNRERDHFLAWLEQERKEESSET